MQLSILNRHGRRGGFAGTGTGARENMDGDSRPLRFIMSLEGLTLHGDLGALWFSQWESWKLEIGNDCLSCGLVAFESTIFPVSIHNPRRVMTKG